MADFVTILTKQQKGLPLSAQEADANLIALKNGVNNLHTALGESEIATQQAIGEILGSVSDAQAQVAATQTLVNTTKSELLGEIQDTRNTMASNLVDINAEFTQVQNHLDLTDSHVTGANSNISGLTTRMGAAEATIVTLQGAVGGWAPASHSHAQGDVTGLTTAIAGKSDVGHGHTMAGISDLAAALLDKAPLVGGKIPDQYLPALAITNVFPVADQAAMLALTAESGDVATYTVTVDLDTTRYTYILKQTPASEITNWLQLNTSVGGGVLSFKGRVGAVEPAAGDYGIADITGLAAALANATPATPAILELRTTAKTIAPGETVYFTETITTDRAYGVSVAPVAMDLNDNVTIKLWGDQSAPLAFNRMMYSSTFTYGLPADTAQAWYYRDFKATKLLRVSITNNGSSTLTDFQADITAEPF